MGRTRRVMLLGVILSSVVPLARAVQRQSRGLPAARPGMEQRLGRQTQTLNPTQSKRKTTETPTFQYLRNTEDLYPIKGHKYPLKFDRVSIGTFYSHYSGRLHGYPYDSYPYYFYYWDPFWAYSTPFFAPGYFVGYTRAPGKGELKLNGAPKKADVFLDGGYAGTAETLKSMWLDPGTYNLAVMAQGYAPYRQRIYVLKGRTLKMNVALAPGATR
jgi:hypothetical protein